MPIVRHRAVIMIKAAAMGDEEDDRQHKRHEQERMRQDRNREREQRHRDQHARETVMMPIERMIAEMLVETSADIVPEPALAGVPFPRILTS